MADEFDQVATPETPVETPAAPVESDTPKSAHDSVREAIAQHKAEAAEGEGRARGPDGKFVAKSTDEAPVRAAPVDQQIKTSALDTIQTPAAASKPVAGPPGGWAPAAKALYASLPPAVQEAVSRREQEVSEGFRQKSEEMKRWQGIEQTLAPRRQGFISKGYENDGQALNDLLRFSDLYDTNPRQLITQLAATAGIDLRQLAASPVANASPAPAGRPQAAPNVIQQVDSLVQSRFAQQDARSAIERFAADKAAHPHFDKVRVEMAKFVQAGTTDLQEAYDAAVAKDPTLRAALIAAQAAQTAAANKAKADASRRASVSPPNGGPPSVRSGPASLNGKGSGDHYDSVRQAIEQLRAG